jgi:hypothetical protein
MPVYFFRRRLYMTRSGYTSMKTGTHAMSCVFVATEDSKTFVGVGCVAGDDGLNTAICSPHVACT